VKIAEAVPITLQIDFGASPLPPRVSIRSSISRGADVAHRHVAEHRVQVDAHLGFKVEQRRALAPTPLGVRW
jgi:hypothetical protein